MTPAHSLIDSITIVVLG